MITSRVLARGTDIFLSVVACFQGDLAVSRRRFPPTSPQGVEVPNAQA